MSCPVPPPHPRGTYMTVLNTSLVDTEGSRMTSVTNSHVSTITLNEHSWAKSRATVMVASLVDGTRWTAQFEINSLSQIWQCRIIADKPSADAASELRSVQPTSSSSIRLYVGRIPHGYVTISVSEDGGMGSHSIESDRIRFLPIVLQAPTQYPEVATAGDGRYHVLEQVGTVCHVTTCDETGEGKHQEIALPRLSDGYRLYVGWDRIIAIRGSTIGGRLLHMQRTDMILGVGDLPGGQTVSSLVNSRCNETWDRFKIMVNMTLIEATGDRAASFIIVYEAGRLQPLFRMTCPPSLGLGGKHRWELRSATTLQKLVCKGEEVHLAIMHGPTSEIILTKQLPSLTPAEIYDMSVRATGGYTTMELQGDRVLAVAGAPMVHLTPAAADVPFLLGDVRQFIRLLLLVMGRLRRLDAPSSLAVLPLEVWEIISTYVPVEAVLSG
jgi:hypothetical protein